MTAYRTDHYYAYDELTAYLEGVAQGHPEWARLESIGASPEGRQIWVLALTDLSTGEFKDKPAYWIDGNTHASELMGSSAALQTIAHVLDSLDEPEIADLLKVATLYICPRVNPDGAEYVLTRRHSVRSARRLYPDEHPFAGLHEQDIDDDGRVLQMRIENPEGAWRVSDEDPRLLLPRRGWDQDGPFYDLYAEGLFDEASLDEARRPMLHRDPHGLDFNRNYPYRWRPDFEQVGAGDYPLSEPETRAVVDFLMAHRNICGMLNYHTYSGVLLRPYSDRPDSEMPDFDLKTFKLLGDRCTELTGFPNVSTFHDFSYDTKNRTTGTFDDWAYDHYGVHCFTMELWSPWEDAGIEVGTNWLDFWSSRDESTELKLLKWNDDKLSGSAFVPWYDFDHPQLGSVQLGGWDWLFSFRNAPASRLESEVQPSVLFSLDHARSLPQPRLELRSETLAPGIFRVILLRKNVGYLPTWITKVGEKSVRPMHLDVTLGPDLSLRQGGLEKRVGHLDGYSSMTIHTPVAQSYHGRTRGHVDEHEWVVEGNGTFEVSWWGDRIGRLTESIVLG